MGKNVAQKLIGGHLAEGNMTPGEEIGLKIDQTLTQDATGTTSPSGLSNSYSKYSFLNGI